MKRAVFIFILSVLAQECCSLRKSAVMLPKCEACELLVKSFLKGIERTEKSNHAGGNTAWEESQLRSYSESEVRFIEIQESLCEENKTTQHQCHLLAEELEEHLEQWWLKDRYTTPDLRHYLCVKKVKYCYPKLMSSDPPPVTRRTNSDGLTCPEGWEVSSGRCEDVNECRSYPCKVGEYCTNTEGSFICRACHEDCVECYGSGPDDCTLYHNLLRNVIANLWNLYHLSVVGPTFVFAYVCIILCGNLVFKIPLMPSLFMLSLVFCVAVKLFLEEDKGDSYDS